MKRREFRFDLADDRLRPNKARNTTRCTVRLLVEVVESTPTRASELYSRSRGEWSPEFLCELRRLAPQWAISLTPERAPQVPRTLCGEVSSVCSTGLATIGSWLRLALGKAAEVLASLVATTVKAAADIRVAEEQTDANELNRLREKYEELIFAVGMKHPGETRHETALRYIRSMEEPATPLKIVSFGEETDHAD